MIPIRRAIVGSIAAGVAVLVCPVGSAQTAVEPPAVSPGARSLGLGGAFVAVADDATASWTNPSGLMQLVRPELSAEGRSWNEDRAGVASNQSSLGFLSFVLPRSRWSLAFYGQTLSSLEFAQPVPADPGQIEPLSSLVVASAGVSAALRLSDRVSLGFGLAVIAGVATPGQYGGPPSYPYFEDDVQTGPGATVGVLWKLDDQWALGASARTGADFTFATGRRAVFPDIVAAGARWTTAAGHATVAAEIEYLGGLTNRVRPHLGGEWVFLRAKPLIGLRGGVWYDPEGDIVSLGDGGEPIAGDGVAHGSAGIGFAWKKFQLDLGADVSDRTTITSISGIVTFGR